jgi:FkbM family methyltransferase
MNGLLRQTCRRLGLDVRRLRQETPATQTRPVGDLTAFLEDMRARGFQPNSIVDIGANRGEWSRTAAAVFPESRFFLLEPIAAFRPELEAFVQDHAGSRFWIAGASESDGTLRITNVTHNGNPTSGSTFRATQHAAQYTQTLTEVPVRSLSSLVAAGEIPLPDLVKIDVEGFEMSVLNGCQALFGKTELFLIEVSLYPFWSQPIFHEVAGWMASHGYLLYDFAGYNRRPADGSLGTVDACFLRAHSPLRRSGGWDQ